MQKPESMKSRPRPVGPFGRIGRAALVALVLLLAGLMLSGCGSERKEDQVGEFWSEQLSVLPGVKDFTARYGINPGMGSTARIRVTATEGTDPHALLVEVLRVAASAGDSVKPSTSISFSVAASEDGPYLDARDAGLEQNPSMEEVIAFVDALP